MLSDQEMTVKTAALTCRVKLSSAVHYLRFLETDDPDQLQRWGIIYNTEDIKEWAKKRVKILLRETRKLKEANGLPDAALNVEAGHVERLARAGFPL